MSTRLSYRYHKHAKAALKAIELAYSQKNAAGAHALSVFAQLCFDALAEKPHALPNDFSMRLANLASASAKLRPDKPLWLVRCEIVLHLSERLLGTTVAIAGEADESTTVHRIRRKDCGTYSTPNHIVDNLVSRVFSELRSETRRRSHLDVVDLSAEAGHFALTSLAYRNRPSVRFHAFDRDPEAVELNRTILGNAQSLLASRDFSFRSSMQESVLGRAEELICADVDAVIGNPPWKTLHPTDGKRLAATYGPLLSARFDVYLAFILRADEMLRAGGMLAMVLPSAFLYNDSASDVRSFLLDRYDPIYLATYPRTAFVEYRGIAPVVIILRKKSAKVVSSTVTRIEMYRSLDETACPAASHTVNPGRDWKGPRAAFAHSAEVLPSSAVAHSHRRTSFTELGLFSSGAKYSSSRGKAADVPFTGVSARNLAPFHVNAGAAVGFAEGAAVFDRPPPVQFLLTTKTFFQTVRCVSLAQRLVAATGKAGELACSTSAMFVPFEPDHAHFISGLLNSSFANAWYKSRDYNHSIKISVLKGLDIPVELSLWNEIGRCARDLSAHQTRVRDNWAATPNRSGAMRSHIDDGDPEGLRRKLDDLVFDLYEVREPDRARLKTLSETRSF